MAVSILSEENFDSKTTAYRWGDSCELIVYSDGLIEAENLSGEQFGLSALLSVIKENEQGKRVRAIKDRVINHLGSEQGDDDISLLAINCEQKVDS